MALAGSRPPPWALEPASGRIRRGRSAGLHGRFVAGGKALPWLHTLSGFVSALAADGPPPKLDPATGSAVASAPDAAAAVAGEGSAGEGGAGEAVSSKASSGGAWAGGGGGRLRCQLQSLAVAQCDWVGSSALQALAACAAGSLTRLDLRNLNDLSPAGATVGWLAQCKRLQEVRNRVCTRV